MSAVTIRVTERDIERGVPRDPCECPVAHAMRRAFRRRVVSAGMGQLSIGRGPNEAAWYTPHGVRFFISKFDDGKPVTPFKFQLSNPKD